MTNTATYLRTPTGFRGDAKVYRLDPPYRSEDGDEGSVISEVIASTVDALYTGPETLVFPLHVAGDDESVDFLELAGGRGAGYDHSAALADLGYEVR